jgi:hypothetical protein
MEKEEPPPAGTGRRHRRRPNLETPMCVIVCAHTACAPSKRTGCVHNIDLYSAGRCIQRSLWRCERACCDTPTALSVQAHYATKHEQFLVMEDVHARTHRCRPLSSLYATTQLDGKRSNESAERWHGRACPWEETRHSGYFSNYSNPDGALAYASHRTCLPFRRDELLRLAGRRIYFVGDSIMRQFTQSFLCRLWRTGSGVIDDNISWSVPVPSRKWGQCLSFSGGVPLRHCFMRDGCVTFQHDVKVCYYSNMHCRAVFAFHLKEFMQHRVLEHGLGSHTFLIMTNGMHVDCTARQWTRLAQTYNQSMEESGLSRSRFTVIYKELDAAHFPTSTGSYDKNADRRKWRCEPVNTSRSLPSQRKMELRVGLPTVRKLDWKVLNTFDTDRSEGASFHATQAPVPSRERPVDCLHWMLPGVPDVWTERLLPHLIL